jgi:hypothetical protein
MATFSPSEEWSVASTAVEATLQAIRSGLVDEVGAVSDHASLIAG